MKTFANNVFVRVRLGGDPGQANLLDCAAEATFVAQPSVSLKCIREHETLRRGTRCRGTATAAWIRVPEFPVCATTE